MHTRTRSLAAAAAAADHHRARHRCRCHHPARPDDSERGDADLHLTDTSRALVEELAIRSP